MRTARNITGFIILNALLLCFASDPTHAGQAKSGTAHRGGNAATHMSNKGSANSNAQWSADPERGWVRADERHRLHDEKVATSKANQNSNKQKKTDGKDKKPKKSGK